MKKSNEYLAEAIKRLGDISDAKKAKMIEITPAALSNYLLGKRIMDDYCAAKVAKILGVNPMDVIAACNEEREKTEERRAFWRGFRSGEAGIQAQAGYATVKGMTTTALSAPALIFVVNAARELWRLC
ncbi:MAG TPA: hypothetical protein VJ642_11035 [Chromobacteriaceae bacterium]|nr:hypothetical protein [Chromobacteriaceae bacterium]